MIPLFGGLTDDEVTIGVGQVLSSKGDADQIRDLHDLFAAMGSKNGGSITPADFHRAMAGRRKRKLRALLGCNLSWKKVLSIMDRNHDGRLDFAEFRLTVCQVACAKGDEYGSAGLRGMPEELVWDDDDY